MLPSSNRDDEERLRHILTRVDIGCHFALLEHDYVIYCTSSLLSQEPFHGYLQKEWTYKNMWTRNSEMISAMEACRSLHRRCRRLDLNTCGRLPLPCFFTLSIGAPKAPKIIPTIMIVNIYIDYFYCTIISRRLATRRDDPPHTKNCVKQIFTAVSGY